MSLDAGNKLLQEGARLMASCCCLTCASDKEIIALYIDGATEYIHYGKIQNNIDGLRYIYIGHCEILRCIVEMKDKWFLYNVDQKKFQLLVSDDLIKYLRNFHTEHHDLEISFIIFHIFEKIKEIAEVCWKHKYSFLSTRFTVEYLGKVVYDISLMYKDQDDIYEARKWRIYNLNNNRNEHLTDLFSAQYLNYGDYELNAFKIILLRNANKCENGYMDEKKNCYSMIVLLLPPELTEEQYWNEMYTLGKCVFGHIKDLDKRYTEITNYIPFSFYESIQEHKDLKSKCMNDIMGKKKFRDFIGIDDK